MLASIAAQHALIKYGPCEVEVVFNLSELGVPSVVETLVAKERCKAFVSSATTALKASEFSKGNKVDGCTINFTMDVDLEE